MGKKSKLDLVPIEENGQPSAPALDLVPLDEEPIKKKDDTSVGPSSESGSTTAPSSAGGLDLQEPAEPSEEPTKERNPAVTLAKTLYSTARYQMPADLIGGTMAMEKMPFDLNEKVFKPMFSWLDSGRPEVKAKLEESTRRKTMLRQAMQLKAGGQEFTKDLVNSLDKADDFVDYLNWAGSAVGQAAGQIPAAILTRGGTAFGQEIGTIYLEGVRKIAEEKKITPEEVIKTGQDDALYPMVFGYAAGSLEMLGAKGVAESFSKKDVMGSLAQRGMAFFKKAGNAGAKESLTEGGQSFIEQVGSSKAADRTWSDTFSSIDPNDIKESMAQGFVGGKALSMVGQAVEKTAKPKAPQTVVQEEKAQVASTSDVQAAEKAAEVIQEKVNQSTSDGPEIVAPEVTQAPAPASNASSTHTTPEQGSERIVEFTDEEIQRQVEPFVIEMVNIEREFQNEGLEISKHYDDETLVLNKKGEIVEPEEIPERLRKMAGQYEGAVTKLSGVAGDKNLDTAINKVRESVQDVPFQEVKSELPRTTNQKVFVYGTLTDPKVRKKALGEEIDATETTMSGVTKEDGEFSTLTTGKGETKGQMIEVTPEQLEKLDKWESKYDRKEIKPGVFAYVRKPNVTAKGKEVDNEAIRLAKEYDQEARNPSIDPKQKAIAAVIGKVRLGKYGDPNDVTTSMAKSYLSKTGTPIDVVAQNASKEGMEVTPDDVWDFMKRFPSGPATISTPAGNPKLADLSQRYATITGKSLNRKTARDMATSLKETLGEERANAESAKFFDKTTDEFSLDALIENMEADPEGYMALHKIGQEEFDHQLNAAHNERAKQGPPDQVYGEDGGTAGQGQGTQSQGGPLSERFGDTSQDTEATVQEIAAIPLTHVPGLNMGKGLSAGTYLSTEEQNRYGDKPQSATVTVKKPFRFKSENDIIPFRNEVLNKNIDKFEANDFADGNDFRREATLEDLSDTGIDKLADLVRKELINEGYDSIYLPATETQEGELIVFDKENVKIGAQEAVKATDSDALIHYGNVGDQRGEVGDPLEVLEEIPISKLSLDEFADINYDNVEKYSKLETEIPPIEVHRDGKENQVYDGNHRVLAAKKKGQKKIKAWVSTVGKDGTFILVKPQKASTPQTTAKANTKTEEQAKTPSKGTYQLQAEQGVAKAEAAVKRAQEVYDEKKAKLGKSIKEDQIDIFGNRKGDEGKLFQEGAGDTQAAKRQLDELKQNIDEAKRDLEDAKAEVAKAKELDKNNLFSEEATTEEPLPGKPTVSGIEFIDDSKALEKKIEETVEDEDGNIATREITLARKQADVKKRLAKLNGLMDCIYG